MSMYKNGEMKYSKALYEKKKIYVYIYIKEEKL